MVCVKCQMPNAIVWVTMLHWSTFCNRHKWLLSGPSGRLFKYIDILFQWNISDYLYHNRDKLVVALANDTAVCPEVPNHAELPPLDKLWMCLYIRLSEYRY